MEEELAHFADAGPLGGFDPDRARKPMYASHSHLGSGRRCSLRYDRDLCSFDWVTCTDE